ncbi:MAG: peroxiredoxin family protein [Chitinophagaceae bacterium]
MKRFVFYILIISFCVGCNQQNSNTLVVNGTIKNSHKNKITLISFGGTNSPIVLDTATLDSKGNYSLKSLTNDEELYAIKVDSMQEIWFVNDTKKITINADLKEYKSYKTVGSSASQALHQFLNIFDSLIKEQKSLNFKIDTLTNQKAKDSLINIAKDEKKEFENNIKNYAKRSVANTNSPALKCFFLHYIHNTKTLDEIEVYKMLNAAQKQFPKHQQLLYLYNSLDAIVKANPKLFLINETAFDFSLQDTSTNKITLKSFTGKTLLLNFYEANNTNKVFVELYNQYKSKGLEILNISLDSNKQAWLKNIKKDSIGWKNTIDTARFNSAIAKKYYVTSLPYNVLINPIGKIIAIDLNDEKLKEKVRALLQ